jgi:hypothetical protein
MKKLVLTTVCALAITGAAFAQGAVNWGSISFTSVTAVTNSMAYSPLFSAGGTPVGGAVGSTITGVTAGTLNATFFYELLYTSFSGTQATVPTLASLLSWQDSGLGATNSNTAGRLQVVNGSGSANVPWSPGTTDSIVLVGWSADLGSSWLTVSNELATGSYKTVLAGQQGFLGITTTGYTTTFAPGTSPGATLFGAATAQGLPITGSTSTPLYLIPVPEPATLALAGLGGLSLLLFRRQRK